MIVSREVPERLDEYRELLIKWNKTINLVSNKTIAYLYERHILDSLQLLTYIKNKDVSIIDLGSGAGLPGIVLSIAGVSNVTLIESDSRKAAFLLQASKLSSNNVNIINERIESVEGLECDVVTSRAFADLNSIFKYSRNIKVKDRYLLHKGAIFEEEVREAKKHWLFNIDVHDSITSDQGKILEIAELHER